MKNHAAFVFVAGVALGMSALGVYVLTKGHPWFALLLIILGASAHVTISSDDDKSS